ncbi:ABC transporter permease [Risungbinella massiliensis]|uniref:ABC transporter permease n=1 Tax=Risungbinella massiliensis TaxID=1329796 RepID=UPI0005CBD4BE|nr:ABC transporter permease [Risungbinella massiliensis]
MSFRKFAFNNVRRNASAYSAYFLSSTFAVMIFFTYAMFIFHPEIGRSQMGLLTKNSMESAEYLIFFFSFLFVLYSNSAFLHARKKEFGILTILGASQKQINGLVFLESMFIGMASILSGVGLGTILAKFFLTLGAKVIEMQELPLYFPWKAMGLTALAFGVLFLLIGILTYFALRKNQVLEMLQGSNKPKKEPTSSIFFVILSPLLFLGALYMMDQLELSMRNIAIFLALGILGTYFFYTQFTLFVVQKLKQNRFFFWRGINLIWISELAFKIKDNARMFFMVTIIMAAACTTVGVVITYSSQYDQQYKTNPFAFGLVMDEDPQTTEQHIFLEKKLQQNRIDFTKVEIPFFLIPHRQDNYVPLIKESEYNRIANLLKGKSFKLVSKETILLVSGTLEEKERSKLFSQKEISIKGESLQVLEQLDQSFIQYGYMVLVSDKYYEKLKQKVGEEGVEDSVVSYYIPSWNGKGLPTNQSEEVQFGKSLVEEWEQKGQAEGIPFRMDIRGTTYIYSKERLNLTSFIGTFIAAVFSIFTASFLYFKLFIDLTRDQQMYHSLSKIGLSLEQMKRSASRQIAFLFFIPLVIAAFQTWIGLSLLEDQINKGDTFYPVLIAIGLFAVAQVVYFLVVRARFINLLKRVMV